MLCRFINPDAAHKVFDEAQVETTVSTQDILFEQISKDLKGKYTPEELATMMEDPKRYSELDRIEKA